MQPHRNLLVIARLMILLTCNLCLNNSFNLFYNYNDTSSLDIIKLWSSLRLDISYLEMERAIERPETEGMGRPTSS